MASPEQLVAAALQGAANPNHEIVQKAEAQLSEWEQQPGFFPILAKLSMKLAIEANAPSDTLTDAVKVRWMAAVYLKNGIERYWRHNSRLELSTEQKQQIRDILLQHYNVEDVPQVALQVAVLLSKIARIDCWPELLPTLMKQLQACSEAGDSATTLAQQHQMQQQRTLLMLHYVIKALASRRLMAEKRAFEELAGQIFSYMAWDIWATLTARFLQLVKTETEAQAHSCLQRAYISMRSLRKLVVFGCGSKPYKSSDHMNFIEQLFERLRQCLELRYELRMRSAGQQLISDLERFILKMMKTLNEFKERHSMSFARFVPMALEFSFHYVFHEGTALIFDAGDRINFSNFVIQAINLLKGIMMNGNDTLAPDASANTLEDELLASAGQAQTKFFSLERVTYLCEKIVTHYFLLTQDELAEWQQDPEGYGQDDGGGDAWKYELRPCVETLYFTCFTQHSTVMINEVLKFVRRAQQLQLTEASELKAILLKDAIYNAVGQASFHFFNKLDFGAWLTSQLLAELRIEAPNFRILRRRIIWLVGHWVGVQLPRELRPSPMRHACICCGRRRICPSAWLPLAPSICSSMTLNLCRRHFIHISPPYSKPCSCCCARPAPATPRSLSWAP